MEKTKFGVSVGLVGAFLCLMAGFGSGLVAYVLMGYILLKEENEWLKKTCVRVLVITVAVLLLDAAVNVLPGFLSLLNSFTGIFGQYVNIEVINKICSFICHAVGFAKNILLLIMAFKALKQESFEIQLIEEKVNKHTN